MGNETADQLANQGTTRLAVDETLPSPRVEQSNTLKAWEDSMKRLRWRDDPMGQHTKKFIENPSYRFTSHLLHLSRSEIRIAVQLFTGHGHLNYHIDKLTLRVGPNCRRCLTEPETVVHLITSCPNWAVARARISIFGSIQPSPARIQATTPGELINFAKQIKIYELFEFLNREESC